MVFSSLCKGLVQQSLKSITPSPVACNCGVGGGGGGADSGIQVSDQCQTPFPLPAVMSEGYVSYLAVNISNLFQLVAQHKLHAR